MYGNNNDNFMTKRASGLLTYRDNNLFDLIEGLSIGIQYQGKNEFSKAYQSNGDGIGYSLGYKLGDGIDVISSYTISNRTHAQQSDNKGKEAETWGVGAKYDVNNLYLAAIYSEGRNSLLDTKKDFVNKSQNFEITAQYQLDFGLRPAISYVMTKGDDLSEATTNGVTFNNGSAFLAKFIEVGASYYFNKNFKVYADYYINMIDKNSNYARVVGGINGNDDMATLGVTYQF
jgi:outer membrane pore protein F